jgi:hypothetical protein
MSRDCCVPHSIHRTYTCTLHTCTLHTCTHAHMHTRTYVHMHMHMYTHICTCTRTRTLHTRTHAHTHTYTHSYPETTPPHLFPSLHHSLTHSSSQACFPYYPYYHFPTWLWGAGGRSWPPLAPTRIPPQQSKAHPHRTLAQVAAPAHALASDPDPMRRIIPPLHSRRRWE